jgi:hypothetical protein
MKRRLIFSFQILLLILSLGIALPVFGDDTGIQFPLKPSPSTGPYDDTRFMDNATVQINGLSGQLIPTDGVELLNLKSTQIQLSKMNVSPEFYQNASQINLYLYQIGTVGETYGTTKRLTDHPNTLGSPELDPYTKARGYYQDSMKTWANISSLFPNATPPTLPDPERPLSN